MRTGPGRAEPEVWFRIVHIAQVGHNRPLSPPYREQTVEAALGPNGVFECGTGVLKLRAPPSQVVRSIPPGKSVKEPKTPRVVELLRKAIEWHTLLESGEIASQAEIARQEGVTRVRVTQIMGMGQLAPEIQKHILFMPNSNGRPPISERILRPIGTIADSRSQILEFHNLLS